MSTKTHYTVLELVPTAAPGVIRAAYKAHVLMFHPDKTAHLSAGERAIRSAVFNEVQAAYDVLGNPALKAAYDATLAYKNNESNAQRSNAHPQSPTRTASQAASKSNCQSTLTLTTTKEKVAMRAKALQSLENLRQRRNERNAEDAHMDAADLNHMAQIWKQLAEDNRSDPAMNAHCAIRVYEYEQKIADREQQQKEWLAKLSTARMEPCLPSAKKGQTTRVAPQKRTFPYTSRIPTRTVDTSQSCFTHPTSTDNAHRHVFGGFARPEGHNHADSKRAPEMTTRAQDRAAEKTQHEAYKQARMDQKAATVRAEKAKQKAKIELQAKQTVERIAKARAKAGAAHPGATCAAVRGETHNNVPKTATAVNRTSFPEAPAKRKKTCGKCGVTHTSFREWRNCNALAGPASPASQDDDGSFLLTL